jgi:hypothetical protein
MRMSWGWWWWLLSKVVRKRSHWKVDTSKEQKEMRRLR